MASSVADPNIVPTADTTNLGNTNGSSLLSGTSSQTVSLAGSNLSFANTYGAGVSSAYLSCIIAAENDLQKNFTCAAPITLNMNFDLQALGAQFSAQNSFTTVHVTYAQLVAEIGIHATDSDDEAAYHATPLRDPSNGAGFEIAGGLAQVYGLGGAGIVDSVVLSSDQNWSFNGDAIGTLEHEITEGAMGRIGGLGIQNSEWSVMDLFRYTASGVHDFTGGLDGQSTFFSIDGSSELTQFHNSVSTSGVFDKEDFADWDSTSGDAFGPGGAGTPSSMSETDLTVMDVIGWQRRPDFAGDTSTTGTLTVNGSASGYLLDDTQADSHNWFRINLSAGTSYEIDVFGYGSGGSLTLPLPSVALHDSSGNYLAIGGAGPNSGARLFYTPLVTGVFYVDVSTATYPDMGTFTVSATSDDFPADDADQSQLGKVSVGGRTTGIINSTSDHDWFLVNLVAGQTYVFTQQGAASGLGTLQLSNLALRDLNGNYLSNFSGVGTIFSSGGSEIIFRPKFSGKYVLDAGGIGTATGSYTISAEIDNIGGSDFNSDGAADLLWRNSITGQIGFWNSNGSGGFSYQTINQGDQTWQIQGVGDFNGDGKADILWRNTVTGQIGPWNSNASGGFTPQIFNEGDLNWQVQGIGDFNRDGSSDILWRNTTNGQVGLWDSNGSAGFTYQTINQGDLTWQIQDVGDFNGDGSADILWRNTASGQVGIWDSNGSGGFTYQTINQGDLTWQIQGVGDFNGDGSSDILWRNTTTGQIGIWDSNGSGGFTYQTINQGELTWQIVGVGDFNGDGKSDILWRNTVTGQVGPWDSNGSGGFTPQVSNEGDLSWNTLNGNDTLIASTANSTLFGNPGNTTFAIGPGAGQDKIYNFATSQDTLQFNHALFANFAAAMTSATQVGANTVFAIDANDSVTLENVNKNSLAASNFRFS